MRHYLGRDQKEFKLAPYSFLPLAFETFGYRTPLTAKYLSYLYKKISSRTGRKLSLITHYWNTRISVTLWRGNVKLMMKSRDHTFQELPAQPVVQARMLYDYSD